MPGNAAALRKDPSAPTRRRTPFINKLADQTDQTELGGKLPFALAERLHISRGEASRRIHEAADLGPRRTLTGQPLPPLLTATAAAQRAGHLGPAHVQVIRCFLHQLPHHVDLPTWRKPKPSWPP